MAGRQDYEGAPIAGVSGNVAGSSDSDYGSQASFGYNFTGGGNDSGDGPANVPQPAPQPAPQPYTPGVTFRGMGPAGSGITLRTGPAGQVYGVVDKRVSPSGYQSPTYNQAFADRMYSGSDQTNFRGERMPTPSEQIMQMRQQATQNPRNIFGEEGFNYDYKTTAPGEALPRRTYGDTVMLNGQEVDLVTGYSEPSVGDIVATSVASMGLGGLPVGLLGGKETYIAGEEPANLQQQPGLAGLFAKAVTGATPEQLAAKGAGMADRLQSFFKGPSEKATAPQAPNMIPGPRPTEIDAMAQDPANMTTSAPRPMAQTVASPPYEGGPTYDEVMPQTVNVSGPTSIPESIAIARANEGSAMGPYQTVDMATPTPRPARNAPNFGMAPTQEEAFFASPSFQAADMDAMASYRGSQAMPVGPDMDATASYRGSRATPVEEGMTYLNDLYGPRTPDDLRSMGIEPSLNDLRSMDLTPAQIIQEGMRQSQPSTQAAPAGDLLSQALSMEAAGTPMVAATSSLEDFVNRNPGIGEALLNSREGQQLNDIMRFGGLDKDKPIKTFVDPETAEIKVQGYDFRGGAKGFNIDASDFFGKIDIVDLLADTLKKGGMTMLENESQRERSERMNQEFLDRLEESERRAAEQGGIFSNIGYRG